MHSKKEPSLLPLTNDDVELLQPGMRVPSEALRYTCHGCRGLFGGIWRTGRVHQVPGLGICLGPEIFYPVGATSRESMAAFGQPREKVAAAQARVARAAGRFAAPLVREIGGEVRLVLAGKAGDRHTLHLLLPAGRVTGRFTPRTWFLFWRMQDDKFQAMQSRAPRPA